MKKYICCIHDKKADTYDGFVMYDNMSQAVRSFQQACEKNEVFSKWPEDFQFVLVCQINIEQGEINEKGEVTKPTKFLPLIEHNTVIAEAKEFIAIQNAKNNQ